MGKLVIKNRYELNPEFEMRELGGEFIAIKKTEQEADPSRVVFMNERCIFCGGGLRTAVPSERWRRKRNQRNNFYERS